VSVLDRNLVAEDTDAGGKLDLIAVIGRALATTGEKCVLCGYRRTNALAIRAQSEEIIAVYLTIVRTNNFSIWNVNFMV
jgi:hypothetical protein